MALFIPQLQVLAVYLLWEFNQIHADQKEKYISILLYGLALLTWYFQVPSKSIPLFCGHQQYSQYHFMVFLRA